MMQLSELREAQTELVVQLFIRVFSESEGAAEGEIIGRLVRGLIATPEKGDVAGYIATENDKVVGSIFFSRFTLPVDKVAFILSPVAVRTEYQGMGIGQKLINYGIEQIKTKGVDALLTYGDPKYYSKVGFHQITESDIEAPYTLTYPEGWLAQSLTDAMIVPIHGPTHCVRALQDQKYW